MLQQGEDTEYRKSVKKLESTSKSFQAMLFCSGLFMEGDTDVMTKDVDPFQDHDDTQDQLRVLSVGDL